MLNRANLLLFEKGRVTRADLSFSKKDHIQNML